MQRTLVFGMFTCVAAAFSRLLLTVGASEAQATATSLASLLTFVGGILLGGRSISPSRSSIGNIRPRDWLLLLVPILFLLRFLPYVGLGEEQLLEDVARWRADPTSFLDLSLLGSGIVLLGVWMYALSIARNLELLSIQPGELPQKTGLVVGEDSPNGTYLHIDHASAWQSLMSKFLGGGVILMLISGGAALGPELLLPDRPLQTNPLPLILIYFLLGLVLAAQTGLDRLRAGWIRSGATVEPGMIPRWLVAGSLLVTTAMLLALLLPTNLLPDLVVSLPLLGPILEKLLWPLLVVMKLLTHSLELLFTGLGWIFARLLALLLTPLMWLLPDSQLTSLESVREVPTTQDLGSPNQNGHLQPERTWLSIIWRLVTFGVPGAIAAVVAVYALWNAWRKRGEF